MAKCAGCEAGQPLIARHKVGVRHRRCYVHQDTDMASENAALRAALAALVEATRRVHVSGAILPMACYDAAIANARKLLGGTDGCDVEQ